MKTLIDLMIIAFIVVFIVDISGAIDSFKSGIKWILTKGKMSNSDYRLKPLDCSLCTTFWVGLIYLLMTGHFTLPFIGFVCLLATFAGILKGILLLIEDAITKIIQLIYKLIDKDEDNNI